MIKCSTLSELSHINHGFFGREGGVSEGLYASLNCGLGSGDDLDKVAINRRRVTKELGTTGKLLTCFQIHSANVLTVNEPWEWQDSPEADAMVTDKPNIPLGILTADCLPVLFADRNKPIIGAAHAGWKGAIGGVLEATVSAMKALGATDIIATIGPGIQQESYEVGTEFYERFMQESSANSAFFTPSKRETHYQFDLPGYAKARFSAAGIQHIGHINHDTLPEEKAFFSYRRATLRDEKAYGRQVSVIMLK